MAEAMNVVRWDGLTEAELDAKERAIAAKYMRIFPWGAVLWGIGNTLHQYGSAGNGAGFAREFRILSRS